jgi:hypothetical protein
VVPARVHLSRLRSLRGCASATEYIRHLPPEKRAVWDVVGRALRSAEVKAAFVRRLAPGLAGRFGPGITVQFYLPPDASATHIGTIFHERRPHGSLPKTAQMKFAPNTGYAFAVGTDTWHSVERNPHFHAAGRSAEVVRRVKGAGSRHVVLDLGRPPDKRRVRRTTRMSGTRSKAQREKPCGGSRNAFAKLLANVW